MTICVLPSTRFREWPAAARRHVYAFFSVDGMTDSLAFCNGWLPSRDSASAPGGVW